MVWFLHRYGKFRRPELEALAEMFGFKDEIAWRLPRGGNEDSPFWYIKLPSVEAAKLICSRAFLVKGMFEMWGEGATWEECGEAVKQSRALTDPHCESEAVTFKVRMESFGGTVSSSEQLEMIYSIEKFLKIKGTVRMKDPELVIWVARVMEQGWQGLPNIAPPCYYMMREVALTDRRAVGKYDLKQRRFLGPTSMEAEMALIMANMAMARKGSLIYDPFVGTGSVIVAAAHFGAYTFGMDIDMRILRPAVMGEIKRCKKTGEILDILTNFKDYDLPEPIALLRADSHMLPFHGALRNVVDAILCDPPYGVRAGGRKSGGSLHVRKRMKAMEEKGEKYEIQDHQKAAHIPSTGVYRMGECLKDLLDMAGKMLTMGGRLVYFLPVAVDLYDEEKHVPSHPMLELVANSEQGLTQKWSRRLVTMRKCKEYDEREVKEFYEALEAKWREEGMPEDVDFHEMMFAAADEVQKINSTKANPEDSKKTRPKNSSKKW